MRNKPSSLVLIIFILLITSFSVQGQIKKSFRGVWDAYAPGAFEGYINGKITITKDSVFLKFPADSHVFSAKIMSFKNDTLTYVFDPGAGIDVTHTLTIENKTKLTGKVSWLSEESVNILTKSKTEKVNKD
jgi:hypothetical protein